MRDGSFDAGFGFGLGQSNHLDNLSALFVRAFVGLISFLCPGLCVRIEAYGCRTSLSKINTGFGVVSLGKVEGCA